MKEVLLKKNNKWYSTRVNSYKRYRNTFEPLDRLLIEVGFIEKEKEND